MLAAAAPADAARPLGAPAEVRLARAGDVHARPGAMTEWWELAAVEPRSGAAVRVRMARGHRLDGVDVSVTSLGRHYRLAQSVDPAQTRSPTSTGIEGTTTLQRSGRAWVLTMTGPLVSGRLTLTRVRRGPTALRWRLGEELRWPRFEPVDMNWSAFVATSRVTGSLTVDGAPVRLDRWRGSLEHVWGRFTVDDRAWEFGNSWVVHQRGDGATLVFGVNRSDTMTGPGARDAQWLGVLARVRADRARVCRPTVRRRGWVGGAPSWLPYATELRARCRGLRIAFRRQRPDTTLWSGYGIAHYEHAWLGTASGGGTGVALVFGHDTSP